MDTALDTSAKTFIEVTEVWVPDGDRLKLAEGNYGGLEEFAAASRRESFAKGEGLPGKAWAEERPVVLKGFDGSYFKRTEAAKEAGLTSAVAVPVFAGADLKAVLVVLCGAGAACRWPRAIPPPAASAGPSSPRSRPPSCWRRAAATTAAPASA